MKMIRLYCNVLGPGYTRVANGPHASALKTADQCEDRIDAYRSWSSQPRVLGCCQSLKLKNYRLFTKRSFYYTHFLKHRCNVRTMSRRQRGIILNPFTEATWNWIGHAETTRYCFVFKFTFNFFDEVFRNVWPTGIFYVKTTSIVWSVFEYSFSR